MAEYFPHAGVYIFDFTPPPPGGGGGKSDQKGTWGKNMKKGKKGKMGKERKGKKEEKGINLKKQDYIFPQVGKQ
jgi:hypothetical protein